MVRGRPGRAEGERVHDPAAGLGGYVIVETDNAAFVAEGSAKFAVADDFEIIPVMDIIDGVAIAEAASDFGALVS